MEKDLTISGMRDSVYFWSPVRRKLVPGTRHHVEDDDP